ncbi:MAG: hypothetical protein NTY77_20535 [Elusimicrobia bacterium]|nr:hypothetical protein [Elusimicrobiota bacterium]
MQKTAALCLALFPFLLTGCMTMRSSKALTITPEPGAAKVTVAADAVAKCYNLILVEWCSLDLRMRQVGGRSANSPQAKQVRAFISVNYDNIISDLSSGSGPSLAMLLDLLQIPANLRVEAILQMKALNLQAGQNAPYFTTLVIDNLLKFQ